jgi:hypothetical protein
VEDNLVTERFIDVVVHVDASILTGSLSLGTTGRLSDFLNTSVKFLKLTEASVIKPNGLIENLDEIHINKEAIKMLITVSKDAGRGVGADYRNKIFPFVRKVPVQAKMEMIGYELNCVLHCKNTDALPQLLERDVTFLPCTEVKIRNLQDNTSWKASFAAVNRSKLSSLQRVASPA